MRRLSGSTFLDADAEVFAGASVRFWATPGYRSVVRIEGWAGESWICSKVNVRATAGLAGAGHQRTL
jgi:hypothetical protein